LKLVVVLDVERGHLKEKRVILELAEATVAVEAQQRSDRTSGVIVVDVGSRGSSADRAHALLSLEHEIRFSRGDPISPRQVVRARAACLVPGNASARVVAGKAVRGSTSSGSRCAGKRVERLHLAAVGTPLMVRRHGDPCGGEAVLPWLYAARVTTPCGAFGEVLTAIERQAVPRPAVLAEVRYGAVSPAVTAEFRVQEAEARPK
jgi:hypothetical protein